MWERNDRFAASSTHVINHECRNVLEFFVALMRANPKLTESEHFPKGASDWNKGREKNQVHLTNMSTLGPPLGKNILKNSDLDSLKK